MAERLYRDLGDGLIMRAIESEDDIRRIAVAHREAFGEDDPEIELLTREVFTKYPDFQWQDGIFVEDTRSKEIVSSICLLPSVWAYEEATLRVAELGIVGTRKEYRRRGLVRAQMEVFERQLQERDFDLGAIEGIAYFYRQFGYEYAAPLHTGCKIELAQIPDLSEGEQETAQIRPLTEADVPLAQAFYEASTRHLCVRVKRDAAAWRYLTSLSEANPQHAEVYIVEIGGQPAGYFRIALHGRDERVWQCREMSDLGYEAILTVLRFMKRRSVEKGGQRLSLDLHPNAPAMLVGKSLDGQGRRPYGWQIRIPNRARFLQKIAPVLERRIAESVLAGLSQSVQMSFYEETIELVFQKGKLERITSLGPTDARGIRLPPYPDVQLLMCYRSREEISDYRLDFSVDVKFQLLVDTLFPKRESYIYQTM
jgi:predicted acetyltransferase